MALKVCSEPGCPELVTKGRCDTHSRAYEARRGSRQARGYDRAHELGRAQDARQVATGMVICWSCHQRISPLDEWHRGHCEDDRSVTHGPEHATCNLSHIGKACPHISHTA